MIDDVLQNADMLVLWDVKINCDRVNSIDIWDQGMFSHNLKETAWKWPLAQIKLKTLACALNLASYVDYNGTSRGCLLFLGSWQLWCCNLAKNSSIVLNLIFGLTRANIYNVYINFKLHLDCMDELNSISRDEAPSGAWRIQSWS